MKFRLPQECRGISIGGRMLPIATDGTIEADTSLDRELAAHVIERTDEPAVEPARAKPRPGKTS